MLLTVALLVDHHLETHMIFTLPTTPHQTHSLTQTLDTPTVHQLATAIKALSPDHSWREVITIFNLMRLKCSMKPHKRKWLSLLSYLTLYNIKINHLFLIYELNIDHWKELQWKNCKVINHNFKLFKIISVRKLKLRA